MKILPGLTYAATKFNLPIKDCMSLKDAFSLSNHVLSYNFISFKRSSVISIVIVSELNKTPTNDIFLAGAHAFLLLPLCHTGKTPFVKLKKQVKHFLHAQLKLNHLCNSNFISLI